MYWLSRLWIYHYFEYVDCNIWFLALVSLAKLHPINAHIWKSPSPKGLFVDIYENDTHAHVYHLVNTFLLRASMKSTFPWMQHHYVNYYKGEQLYETNRRETALTHPRTSYTNTWFFPWWFGNRHRQKSLFVDKYENDTHAPVYYQYDTYVAEFHKKRKMYTSSVADKWCTCFRIVIINLS
jgi:hypothetical protein